MSVMPPRNARPCPTPAPADASSSIGSEACCAAHNSKARPLASTSKPPICRCRVLRPVPSNCAPMELSSIRVTAPPAISRLVVRVSSTTIVGTSARNRPNTENARKLAAPLCANVRSMGRGMDGRRRRHAALAPESGKRIIQKSTGSSNTMPAR
ncbi:hypothetical protein SDC9_205835 [bioreactor metagenome]|uniref:Uncharacterized protein n=1 Tax=bioreactor metagenome TaxID=1076179 RepID=A0A645JCK8_9ZZZZ